VARVLDLTNLSGVYAARLLAEEGARVVVTGRDWQHWHFSDHFPILPRDIWQFPRMTLASRGLPISSR
jgi:hypothetical protein